MLLLGVVGAAVGRCVAGSGGDGLGIPGASPPCPLLSIPSVAAADTKDFCSHQPKCSFDGK